MTNLYAVVDLSDQGDEGSESGYGSDVEQSAWYTADPIAIAASDLEKVNRMLLVWDSIEAIVECSPQEWEEKREKWSRHIKAQANFVRKRFQTKYTEGAESFRKYWQSERNM